MIDNGMSLIKMSNFALWAVDPAARLDPPDRDLGVGGSNLSADLGRADFSDFPREGSRREGSHRVPASAGEVKC